MVDSFVICNHICLCQAPVDVSQSKQESPSEKNAEVGDGTKQELQSEGEKLQALHYPQIRPAMVPNFCNKYGRPIRNETN